jgi:hypothetical protein
MGAIGGGIGTHNWNNDRSKGTRHGQAVFSSLLP